MCLFPIRIADGDAIIKHIFPSKQKDVQTVINQAKNNIGIKRVFVFGSATTWNCGPFSDLDIAIEHDVKVPFEQVVSPFFRCVNGKTDIIEYNLIHDESLRKNVENGVLVYEKHD